MHSDVCFLKVFPRLNITGCAAAESKMISYCDAGDRVCEGGEELSVHRQYVQKYGAAAVDFIVSKVNGPGV